MEWECEIGFDPADPEAALALLPAGPAVFALGGASGEPYLNRTADLRRRLRKLLAPGRAQTRRLELSRLVRRIAWSPTASEFGAQLALYRAAYAVFSEDARRRLRLRAPFFLRMGMRNRFPRVWITNSLPSSALADLFGPFPSRYAAERYAEDVLDLHLLRRCFQDLAPDPEFPGCIYSEMKKCLAPCYGGCSDGRYREETAAVHGFLHSRGESMKAALAAERDAASARLDFEAAAAAHGRWLKAESAAKGAGEWGAVALQHAAIVQPSAEPDQVELTLLRAGALHGPTRFSLLGMQLPNENSGSSSLFAHPAAMRPASLSAHGERPETPEDRLGLALAGLAAEAPVPVGDSQALLARWWFRPQAKREGELVPAAEGAAVSLKQLLRACARVLRAQVEHAAVHA